MRSASRPEPCRMFVAIVVALFGYFLIFSTRADAQSKGNNAVFNASGTCTSSSCGFSAAFIDASVFGSIHTDICTVLNSILNPSNHIIPSAGAVIDARGLPATGTLMTCTASPWAGISNPPPSTILLPATGGTTPTPIIIPTTWIVPSNTHVIGQGDSIGSGTTIQGSMTSGTMIQFANSSSTGISVENLVLDGQGQSINGIVNQYAGDHSYVDHVSLYRIRGTGLLLTSGATGSGPYSNITFDLGGFSGTSSTVCANLNGLSGTRGIHGLTCISANNDPPAAVLLDSSNNSIEDVRIAGFYDGILVGENADAKSNVLINIFGDTASGNSAIPINAVHITNSSHNVSDLSIVGLANIGGPANYSLEDDRTGPHLSDTSVGIYALGESASGGYSRFTTSPNAATWAVGSGGPPSTCSAGGLYSNISGSGTALYGCSAGGGGWHAIK